MYEALNVADLRDGDILLFTMGSGLWGRVITAEERDTDVEHAAFVGRDGVVWSTGVAGGMLGLFGSIDAAKYLHGRRAYVCRFDDMTPTQVMVMDGNGHRCHGMRYGLEKVVLLSLKARLGGVVRRLYPWLTKVVKHPFCSEHVADSCWRAGIRICENMGKEEPSAISPANIKQYALMKGTNLNIVGVITG